MWTYEVIQLVICHLRDEVIEIERINVDMIGPPKIVYNKETDRTILAAEVTCLSVSEVRSYHLGHKVNLIQPVP